MVGEFRPSVKGNGQQRRDPVRVFPTFTALELQDKGFDENAEATDQRCNSFLKTEDYVRSDSD